MSIWYRKWKNEFSVYILYEINPNNADNYFVVWE